MISSRFISDLPFVVALGFCFFISIPGIGLATPGYRFVLINLFIGLASGMIIWAAGRWIRGKLAGLVISSMMLIMLLVVARGLNQKISERDTWILSRPLAGAFACAINAPLRYVPIRGASNSVVDELVQGLSSRGELYDSMDSMLNHDQPLFTGHADVIPERTFRLIELSKASPDSYHAFAMDGLPKAYLADQPVKIFSKNIKAEPGDVYLETEKDLLRLKRKDDSKLEVEKFSFNQVTFDLPIEKDVKAPRFLVYEDSWHSEWTANAGGKAATVYPANLAFKAVEIAPGVNQVTFRFGSIQRYVLVYLNALLALSVLPAELMALIFLDRDPFLFVNPCKTPRE